jgi:hypothetical protein
MSKRCMSAMVHRGQAGTTEFSAMDQKLTLGRQKRRLKAAGGRAADQPHRTGQAHARAVRVGRQRLAE